MNPWTASFEEHRQNILGEDKKKSEKQSKERWQDDDGDNDWYEPSDVDGKISDREKKEKKKNVKVKEDITLTRGDYGSRNVVGSAWHTAAKRGFKGYTAGGGLTPQFKLANSHEPEGKIIEGNQRDPEGQEKDRKKSRQSDPSKDNFTGISGSIATIMKQNAAMKKAAAKKKKVKEEVVTEKISASGYARAKKWREEQAREKDRKEQEHFRKKAQTHKWDGEKWNKREPSGEKNENVEINHIDGSKTEIVDVVRRPAMVAAPKFSDWKEEMEWQDEALKPEKLDVKETGVKNKIEINPEIKTESKKQKYDNTKSPDYEQKKEKLKKKHGGNIKGHPQYEHHQKDANGNTIPHDLDEGIGSFVQKKLEQGFNAADKVSAAMDKNPVTSLIKKGAKALVSPTNPNNKGSNYTKQGKIANSYEPEGEMIEEKKKLSNCSPLIDRVSKWSKTMKKEEVISERDRYKFIKGGNLKNLAAPKGQNIKHGVTGVDYTLVQGGSSKKVDKASYEPEGEVVSEGPSDKSVERDKRDWKGPGAPGLDAHRERIDRHKKKRGKKKVREEALDENPLKNIKDTIVNSIKGIGVIKQAIDNPGTGLNPNTRKALELNKKLNNEGKKKKDDTYLEPNWEKRKKNNEKARKDLQKGPQMKNPHLESIEVVVELNRYGKETGKATGSINKRPGSKIKKGGDEPSALRNVRGMIRRETGKPEGQRKKNKGEKGRQQPGDRRGKPADTIARRRQSRKDADAAMRDTRGT